MRGKDQKKPILYQLSQESESISLPLLLSKLGGGYSERSLRRWLNQMVEEHLIEKSGQKRGTKYRAVGRADPLKNSAASCFGSESRSVIAHVRRPLYERHHVSYSEGWLEAYDPNKSFYIPSHHSVQLHEAGRRSENKDPAGTYARQIFNRLLIDLSFNSSRLEGNTYSLLDTQRLLIEGTDAQGKLDEEKVMILNHKEAIRYLVDNAPQISVSIETICTLHYLLADGLLAEAKYAGKVRDTGVRIGGSTYIPYEDPKRLQLQLRRIAEKAALINDPYEQSLFLLIHVSYLQAFLDVNKRTARLCANIPLIKKNLVPLSFNDVERDDYSSAIIAVYELQNVQPIVDLYVFSYMRTCAAYDSTVKALGIDEIRVRYRQQRRAVIREVIVKELAGIAMEKYVASQGKSIPQADREAFLNDVREDLQEMDYSRMAGLGITTDQLERWMKNIL